MNIGTHLFVQEFDNAGKFTWDGISDEYKLDACAKVCLRLIPERGQIRIAQERLQRGFCLAARAFTYYGECGCDGAGLPIVDDIRA